ncbi:MAG: PAS domain S-box protein [Ferruginibacter sp.]
MAHPLINNFAGLLNEESYKDLFDKAHDLIHFISPEGIILYVNQSWCDTLGYPLDEILGSSVYDYIILEDREGFIGYRQHIMLGNVKESEITVRFLTKSGVIVSLEGFVSLRKTNDTPLYTRGIFRDITAKLQNETHIREREMYMVQLLENAPDAVIVIDEEGKINFWNPKAESLFGWPAAEVMGQALSGIIIPPAYRSAHEQGMKRFKSTGEAHVLNKTIEITALKKSGDEFHISLTISQVDFKQKKVFIAFLRDITQRKTNEAQLEHKQKQLEASNELLGQYAYVASHDLQEPLRKIRLFSEMLSDLMQPGTQQMIYAGKIITSAERMRGLINSLLDYSNLSTGDISFEIVDLNFIMENVLADFELLIEQKNASVKVDRLPNIMALPLQMNQLFYNLVGNALKFTRPDIQPDISITNAVVTIEQIAQWGLEQGREYYLINIKDNGVGFDQDYAGRIFNIFQRLNSTKEFGGNGIGLALCKKVVETHNGQLFAEGKLNEGASFTIILPAKQM